jgi:hypothetical protein
MSYGNNNVLIGKAEEIDLVMPEVRKMLDVQGIYLAADSDRPGYTVPLVCIKGKVYSMVIDTELDHTRFLPTVLIAGPFYAPGEEQEASGG